MSSATLLSPPRLSDVLSTSPLPHLRRLVVAMRVSEVVITSQVPSYYLKQLAQESLRPTLGRRRLRNRVVVSRG